MSSKLILVGQMPRSYSLFCVKSSGFDDRKLASQSLIQANLRSIEPREICSNPADAHVWIDSVFCGKTPMIAEMKRDSDHYVRIELEGYRPYEIHLTRNFNGWLFGNIIFGGVLGIVVDAVTGAIFKLTPSQIYTEFYQYDVVHSRRSKDSFIAVVLKADPSWEEIGNLE